MTTLLSRTNVCMQPQLSIKSIFLANSIHHLKNISYIPLSTPKQIFSLFETYDRENNIYIQIRVEVISRLIINCFKIMFAQGSCSPAKQDVEIVEGSHKKGQGRQAEDGDYGNGELEAVYEEQKNF
ncbi:uncharacterized protein LOC111380288 [Olea europaea var. sylvestris]|uniref:uncharacterized protein LOC111380288 n=1 Tax=Olea europaea var. sylvestris TaxID=158386 RepID=UPI000C1D3203|nr:uncharacterized protein LOC111380288 [Olea europaea var. sylvestris]